MHQTVLMYSPGMTVVTAAGRQPPGFLRLAAHPLRWRLLVELAHSDLRVRELSGLLGQPQPLVSYHPGLRRQASAPAASGRTARARRVRVLFLCTGNSARSQIAEALAGQLSGGTVEAASAGSHPKPVHANTVRVIRERGIDLAGRRSKHLREFAGRRFDYVVSICDRVREVCREFPGKPELSHWSIPDPARAGATDDESYPAFQRTASELAPRIPFLLDLTKHN